MSTAWGAEPVALQHLFLQPGVLARPEVTAGIAQASDHRAGTLSLCKATRSVCVTETGSS